MKLKEITTYLEHIAPIAYQESYDNAGLICGNESMEITAALICLDSTEAVLDEAISMGCNLIIAHHPIVFTGLKKFNGKNYVERVIIKAIKNDIAIYAAHTNLDNAWQGVNAKIAEKLQLKNYSLLSPQKNGLKKLVTLCPEEHADSVRNALFVSGGGRIGEYEQCSFNTNGIGTFKPSAGAKPFVGEIGKLREEKETKIELIYPAYLEHKIVNALLKTHPYEEVAYDLISLTNGNRWVGAGIVGELSEEIDELSFLKQLKITMKAESIRYTALRGKKVKKIAICGGAGSFLLQNAIKSEADVFVTADFKYHQYFDAENQIVIADIGHYESEQFTIELFYELLNKKFSTFAIHLTKINTNPIKYI
jgi:dinuclear metal center YbgI/SA1388 family protein